MSNITAWHARGAIRPHLLCLHGTGTPTVAGAKVTAKVLKNGKNKKIYVFKYKSKKNEKKKIGHRQPFTKVQIVKIEG